MSIYPLRNRKGRLTGRYRVEVTVAGERRRARCSSIEEAEARERELRSAAPAPREPGPSLADHIKAAVDELWNPSTQNAANVRAYVERLLEVVRSRQKLDTPAVVEFVRRLQKRGLSAGTINRHLSAVSRLSRHLVRAGVLQAAPVIDWQRETGRRLRYLTEAEEALILQWLTDSQQTDVADAFVVAVDTGLRRSELLGLQRSYVDGEWINLPKTKNGDGRSVPMTPRAREALGRLLDTGMPTARRLRYVFETCTKRLGLSDVVWHTLRHTTATRLMRAGVSPFTTRDFLGHRNLATTMLYCKVGGADLQKAAAALGQGGGAPGGAEDPSGHKGDKFA